MLKIKHKKIIILVSQIIFLIFSSIYLFFRPFFITKVVGKSMEPSLLEGQIVLASSLDKNYSIGDVVLVNHEQEVLIKRIAYVPGQKILICNLGWREFCPIPPMKDVEKQIKILNSSGVHTYIYKIPKNHFFVIGDNETISEDSRNFGAIPKEEIFAKILEK
jgi:signal peptidase I